MKSLLLAISVLLASTGSAVSTAERVLTTKGLGPVAIDMTVPQAEAALKSKLEVTYPEANPNDFCGYAHRADKQDPDVGYMVEAGRITRIDISSPSNGPGRFARVTTAEGVGLGDPADKIRRAYGHALKIEPHPYDDNGNYYKVGGPKGSGVIFEVIDGKVDSFRAGRYPSVGYIEGCL